MPSQIIWIGLFVAAAVVQASRKGNLFIVLGLCGFGLPSLMGWLEMQDLMPYTLANIYYRSNGLLDLAAAALLVFGVFKLASAPAASLASSAPMQDSKGVNVTTLFTPRNTTNTFSRAEVLRDQACGQLVELARRAGIPVIEQHSQAHSPTVWFRLDYQLPSPQPGLSLTASVGVEIERFDFHRFEHTFTVTAQVGTKVTKRSGIYGLDEAALAQIHEHIVTPGQRLRLKNRLRRWPFQLWRPRNKVRRLKPDWVAIGLASLAVGLLLVPTFGIIAAAAIFILLYFRARQRRTYVLTSGKPLTDPRSLRWMDSWQASIFGLGELATTVQQGIMARLNGDGPQGASVRLERIGYWGTDSWVEREQIVVNHRRAIGFIHVAPYADVLYVAWEAHLNSASWIEESLATGVDRESGLDVVANRVVSGWHRLNEYDVSDSSFLAEWVHEAVKREVKIRMAEHRIDQEIDFTVQHESRTDTLTASSQQREADKAPKKKRFARVA